MICEWCGTAARPRSESNLLRTLAKYHVHHVDYRQVGNERFLDLVIVCWECHERLHKFFDRLVSKGFKRRDVMDRLRPFCIRRMLTVHEVFGGPLRSVKWEALRPRVMAEQWKRRQLGD